MRVTDHAEKRIRERAGIPKRAVARMSAKALDRGIQRLETKGSLRRYLDMLYMRHNGLANNIRVYANKVFIFKEETLITILNLPVEYQRLAKRCQKEST